MPSHFPMPLVRSHHAATDRIVTGRSARRRSGTRCLWLGSLLFALSAATTACHSQTRPDISVRINYVEIPVTDLDRAISFYEQVFEVTLDRLEIDGYRMARFPGGESGEGAYVALAQGDVYVPAKSGPIVYVRVDDIAGVLARAEQAGATVLLPTRDIGEDGLVAEFEDSEGNRIALNQPR